MSDIKDLSARFNQHNDAWNATKLYDKYKDDWIYCDGDWYYWDGKVWKKDVSNYIPSLAIQMMESILEDEPGKSVCQHIRNSGNNHKIDAMLSVMSKKYPHINKQPIDLNGNYPYLYLQNGMFNLETMKLEPHRKDMLMTRVMPVSFDLNADAPNWYAFINRICIKHPELVGYIQRIAGYTLSHLTREQCMFIFFGDGMNGKTTLINTLNALFGEYTYVAPNGTFVAKKNDNAIPNDIAAMDKCRFMSCMETGKSKYLNEPLIKQLTGSDPISARFLHKEFFTFTPICKIWLATNHKPTIESQDCGIWRKLRLIPLDSPIQTEEIDKFYSQHGMDMNKVLLQELSGILNWMLCGWEDYKHHRLDDPLIVTEIMDEFRDRQDALGQFIHANCECGAAFQIQVSDFYKAFKEWGHEQGFGFMKRHEIQDYMDLKGFIKDRETTRIDGHGCTFFYKIRLLDSYNSNKNKEYYG